MLWAWVPKQRKRRQPLWEILEQFLQQLKTELSTDPASPLLGTYPKGWKQRHEERFVQSSQKVEAPKGPPMSECRQTKCATCTWCDPSGCTRQEVMTHGTTRMNLEDTMLTKTSQPQKTTVWFHLYEVFIGDKFIGTVSTVKVTGSWGERRKGVTASWVQSYSFVRQKSSQNLLCHNVNTLNTTETYT